MAYSRKGTKSETAPLKWKVAQNILRSLLSDGKDETRLLFALGFYTGLRIGDILKLDWMDLIEADKIEVQEGKTKKLRTITIGENLKRIIAHTYKQIETLPLNPVFIAKRGNRAGQRLSVHGANYIIKKTLEGYGIAAQNTSSHTLRKTFARRVYDNNHKTDEALLLLSKMLNHSSTAITRLYIGLTSEKIENAYLNLD